MLAQTLMDVWVLNTLERAMPRMHPKTISQVTATYQILLILSDVMPLDGKCISGKKDGRSHAANGERNTNRLKTIKEESQPEKAKKLKEEENRRKEKENKEVMQSGHGWETSDLIIIIFRKLFVKDK